jgi:beta-galactosidase
MRPNEELATGWRFRFEDDPWESIRLPHSWNALDTMSTDPATHYRRGVGIYELDFVPPSADDGDRVWLEFGAVAQRGRVYFDGDLIAEHHGGYTAFRVEVPNQASLLRVEADNRPDPELIPSDMSDFFLYGGITRPVTASTTGAVAIERLFFDLETSRERATITLRGRLNGVNAASLKLQVRLTDPVSVQPVFVESLSIRADRFNARLPDVLRPKLWSPDTPNLYHVHVTLLAEDTVLDTYEADLGFRWFRFPAGGPFYLNDKRLLLKGTHRHDDWAGYGAAVPRHLIQAELEAIKSAGFNFIRLGHYPQDDFVLHLCDRLGLIVWEEIPWCRGGVGGEVFKGYTRQMLIEMIEAHYNNPSIVFWGLGNELDWESEHPASTDEAVADFLRELHQLSHAHDPRRLTAIRRFDYGSSIIDVYSPSIWSGWYRGRYSEYETALRRNMERYPRMLHIEWGGDSQVGRHKDGPHATVEIELSEEHDEIPGTAVSKEGFTRYSRDGDWSESYIIDLMAHHLAVQARQPDLAGTAQWIFKDFGTPLRPENPVPFVNQKGLVDRAGRRKDVYYVFKAFQSDEPVVHIESSGWPVRVGQVQTVRVITNCETVTLQINGQSVETYQADTPAGIVTWQVTLEPGDVRLTAIGERDGKPCVRHEVTQTVVPGNLGPVARILTSQTGDADGPLLNIQLADADGYPVATDERRVQFDAVEGGLILRWQGVMGGSDVVQTANGRAWVRLQPDDPGLPMRVKVTVEGLEPLNEVIYAASRVPED